MIPKETEFANGYRISILHRQRLITGEEQSGYDVATVGPEGVSVLCDDDCPIEGPLSGVPESRLQELADKVKAFAESRS